jgi:hypothetical protein
MLPRGTNLEAQKLGTLEIGAQRNTAKYTQNTDRDDVILPRPPIQAHRLCTCLSQLDTQGMGCYNDGIFEWADRGQHEFEWPKQAPSRPPRTIVYITVSWTHMNT